MIEMQVTLSLVIVTYNRERVLVETIQHLLPQLDECERCLELLVIDQTPLHEEITEKQLGDWNDKGMIRWIRLPEPDLVGAMNRGLVEAQGDLVLYTDDDIIPLPDLLENHLDAHHNHPEVSAVVGQVLQPGQKPEELEYQPSGSHLRRFMNFPFNSTRGCHVENVMAGNLSVIKKDALALGGFDENFRPPVASRFESEFAKRLIRSGRKIWFEPSASIHHLASKSGGTRSKGSHLSSASPRYGVGDYYFALLHGEGWDGFSYCLRRLLREVRTRFHLSHPWYIPVKLLGETRALIEALSLLSTTQKLIAHDKVFKS